MCRFVHSPIVFHTVGQVAEGLRDALAGYGEHGTDRLLIHHHVNILGFEAA
jgi:hypothetical protein